MTNVETFRVVERAPARNGHDATYRVVGGGWGQYKSIKIAAYLENASLTGVRYTSQSEHIGPSHIERAFDVVK